MDFSNIPRVEVKIISYVYLSPSLSPLYIYIYIENKERKIIQFLTFIYYIYILEPPTWKLKQSRANISCLFFLRKNSSVTRYE